MKNKKIFPVSVLNQSVNQFIYENSKRTNILYQIVLIAIFMAFAALYFIEVDVSVQATGIIKPKGEKNIVTSPIDGKIHFVTLSENIPIDKGDSLFVIQSDNITVSREELLSREKDLVAMLADLNLLLKGPESRSRMATIIYQQEMLFFNTQLAELKQKEYIATKNYDRNKKLYDDHVVAGAEFDQIEFEYNAAKAAIQTLINQQHSQWAAAKDKYEVELRDVRTKLDQIAIQNEVAVVCSPINGVIQKILNVSDGSYVHNGQQIAEVSPTGDLYVECYVTPKDIGYLVKGTDGKFQVDAFNYNDWGMLNGRIEEIFNDVEVNSDNTTYFYKIYCSLNSKELKLKNGYVGHIKKGMTVNTRFVVTRRTLYQLLYDKIDDWLNPNTQTK